ncbi:MAG: glycosyltransferase family 2 protein [Lachnospiraceae bacterium]|nr:glycosyltransferase family 2 protein [Lachnospiraceae bacterium]
MPVYNNSEYLIQCLKSIQNQTYSDLQIICIDDGSTDSAGEIADEMAKSDNRFTVIHQTNHGESHARNTGLRIAKGNYIAFCDCDDWIEPDMYGTFINKAEETEADIVAGSWYKEKADVSEAVVNDKAVMSEEFGRDELLRYIYERDSYQAFAYMWNKLYKREMFYDKDGEFILFDESLELGGDVLYLARLAINASKAVYVDIPFYHYRIKEISGSHTTELKKLRDWVKAYEMTVDLMKQNKVTKEIIDYIVRFMAYRCSNIVEEAVRQEDDVTKKEFQKHMKRYEPEYIRLNQGHADWIERYKRLETI